jgi:hypothetical protein
MSKPTLQGSGETLHEKGRNLQSEEYMSPVITIYGQDRLVIFNKYKTFFRVDI